MDVDPAASLRCWAIEIELGGRVYEIPAAPAADWWPVLSSADPLAILDMVTTDSMDLDGMLLSGEVTSDDLTTAITDAIEAAAGRSMHAVLVIVAASVSGWQVVNGYLTVRGFRWDQVPLGAALDAVQTAILEHLEDEPRKKFLALLDNEALTTGRKTERQRQRASAEFESLAGPKPASGAIAGPSGSARPRTRTRPRPPRQPVPSAVPSALPGPPAGSGPAASS